MKLFLYALMTTFLLIGCESYHRDDAVDRQEQEESEEKAVETRAFPDKGGNAGNR